MQTIFREYDIRGIFERELNEQTVKLIGYFLGKRVKKFGDHVAIGYDARIHSPVLFDYLASGFNAADVTVMNMGIVPTPVNYFAHYQSFSGITPDACVMITGSHNPPEYNGFKITVERKPFFGEDIYALGEEIMTNMDKHIPDHTECVMIDAKERYIDYMLDQFVHLKGMDAKIVADCGNGVAGVVVPEIFEGLDFDCEILYPEPDGTFPNHHPDPTVEENLADIKAELAKGYDIGFAYDGDADRIAVLTKNNNIKGDILALLFAKEMDSPVVVGEVKCSQIMYDEIDKLGRSIMYKAGHSNLKVKMNEVGATLAAEVSGHIFFKDRYFGFDDAIYATLRVLELIQKGMDLDGEIEKLPKLYSTEEIKIKTTEQEKFLLVDEVKKLLKNPPEDFPDIRDIIDVDGVRVIFEHGWGLVRASNTTPVLVTRFEADSEEMAQLYQDRLSGLIEEAKKIVGEGS